jgi:hypothetical protein
MNLKFVCKRKKSIFVAFHFYFLLDLFQTALSFRHMQFFYFKAFANSHITIPPQTLTFKECFVPN